MGISLIIGVKKQTFDITIEDQIKETVRCYPLQIPLSEVDN
jgi:hypothetical protein